MSFVPFELERWQSEWEHRVHINLSESGVHPLAVSELLKMSGADVAELLSIRLGYSQADGTDELRNMIASLYPGATTNGVIVTVGSSEANFITCWTLIEPGDRVAILAPLYRQTWGLTQNFGAVPVTFDLKEDLGWEPDPADVAHAITSETKLVVVTNPNNPTGHLLSDESRSLILELTEAAGAWLLVDEVYQGAELDGATTPSFWGRYERTVVVNGLSKAYGLPGLRIGWAVGPDEFKQRLYKRHDYTVICPTAPSDFLARQALAIRSDIFSRTRAILNENYALLSDWLADFGDAFTWHPPQCGAICFARVNGVSDTVAFAHHVREKLNVLLQPGEHFGLDGFIRFGYGNEKSELREALEILRPAFDGR